MTPFWIRHRGADLMQGDFLPGCLVPLFDPEFGLRGEAETVSLNRGDLIVVTQSCDLANQKAVFVALCPISTLAAFEAVNPKFKQKGAWEDVRRGRREGLHMLASPDDPGNNREALVVDFRQIYSLPFAYLTRHSEQIGDRWRLQSPFVEHFSQAFARFFMRVGLPSAIPPFK
ncbi:MAG: hypothetical protein KY476_05475 [Planctomycetes bacterium]|nr:hypothetical protein [Planctomycetota bacterium]